MEQIFTNIYENAIWGNNNNQEYNGSSGKSDVWYSADGESWIEATAAAAFNPSPYPPASCPACFLVVQPTIKAPSPNFASILMIVRVGP